MLTPAMAALFPDSTTFPVTIIFPCAKELPLKQAEAINKMRNLRQKKYFLAFWHIANNFVF
jgi:hypothetical protein